MDEQNSRDRIIIRTSIIGIAANVLLAAFKAVVGLTANSIARVPERDDHIGDRAVRRSDRIY